ncbi:ESAT-6-like protein EsxE [Austwickia sp. TVS 96-490-7B]|uniref:WXG100 family type VII secretion target n=1 Tax=Austwickia sp. TVS 96-490-7B TaxID=2830843 RepID=UPI001C55EB58|nr:WXG100 family type VII secretion target [Austwickia sp. TVS 96-490-7B]MBW3086912.1 ESAT-6-like protein EsxE [Austwickia sp. TVS 96-490-7B]
MTIYKIDAAALDRAIADLTSYTKTLADDLADIDRAMGRLQHSWTGNAANAQAEAHQKWLKGAQKMRHAVRVMEKAATTARGNYTGAVEANIRIWES